MADYITLMGAEQVQNAARQMQSAAEAMCRAASGYEYAVQQQQRFMDDWLQRFTAAMETK